MPTQMGRTVSLFTSFRITIGILLAGSMTRPRIFISTSINRLPGKAVRIAVGDPHRHVAARSRTNRLRSREVDGFVLRTASNDLATALVEPFNRCFQNLPYMVGIVRPL